MKGLLARQGGGRDWVNRMREADRKFTGEDGADKTKIDVCLLVCLDVGVDAKGVDTE